MPGVGGHDMVVLRGLILYKVCKQACIYNPTTRQNVTLPAVKSNIFSQERFEKYVTYFFGYDPVLDQYKVICIVSIFSNETLTSEQWVFILEVGGFWKRIEFNQPHYPTELGVSISGVIYYLVDTCISGHIIVSFKVKSEEFSMIQAPDDVYELNESMTFIEYNGKPAIFDYIHLREEVWVNLWVLEDGGKWSKKSRILRDCQMHLVNDNIDLMALDTTRNGDIILTQTPLISPYYILYYESYQFVSRNVHYATHVMYFFN